METEKHIVLVFPKFGQNLKKFIKANIDKAKKETKTFTVDDFVFIFRQIVSAVS